MEKVSLNSCVFSPLNGTKNISAPKATQTPFNAVAASNIPFTGMDTVSFRSKDEIYAEKLNSLFPNGELSRIYDSINKDFGIDKPAELKLYGDHEGAAAGGFTFAKNEISLSLSDMLGSDTKIVGIKNGKRTVLVSPKVKLPLFVDRNSAAQFIQMHSQHGNLGFDSLVAEPVTPEEQRKLVIQKIAHEVIHSQQHMIMRQTEGIGEKEIIKAWTHEKPKNLVERAVLAYKVSDMYGKSYWAGQPETQKTVGADSPKGQLAKIWLEAIRNYPSVDSPEYDRNAIEVDAYERSANYVNQKYGAWS